MSSREPGLGQPAIPNMERPSFTVESLYTRNAFARAATPGFHGLFIEDYAELTVPQIEYVTPHLLESSLLRAPKNSPNSVYYRNPEDGSSQWVAVTPAEFKQLGGNITTLGNRVMSSVLQSRWPRADYGPDREAAHRGGVHAVSRELEKLETYKASTLSKQLGEVHWLAHAANHPGKAWKQSIDLRILMNNIRGVVFQDMLLAAREAHDWSPEKAAGVEKVLDWKLFFDRANNNHIENWKQVLAVTDTYLGYKKALYGDKIAKAKQFIHKHDV